jgi:DNA-binding FrmR family transcriptional regulator
MGEWAMAHKAHSTHPAIIKRLNRATGHLRSIVTMVEDDRPCVDIAQQLQAVENAIASAKRALINDHIDHCLVHAEEGDGPQQAIDQFRAISKYW